MVKKIDKLGFEEALRTVGKPVVVNFSTDWCPFCKRLAPIIEEIADERNDEIDVYYIDTDAHEDVADQYEVMTVPTVFVFVDGKAIRSAVNPKTKEAVLKLIFNE